MEPKTGKRIVSKEAYAANVGKKAGAGKLQRPKAFETIVAMNAPKTKQPRSTAGNATSPASNRVSPIPSCVVLPLMKET